MLWLQVRVWDRLPAPHSSHILRVLTTGPSLIVADGPDLGPSGDEKNQIPYAQIARGKLY